MSSMKIRNTLEDYFKSMNPISEKIVTDVQLSCKDEDWGLFPNEEQSAIQWRKFIDPCVEEKYRSAADQDKSVSCFPVWIVETGEKLVIDEDTSNGRPFGSSWKDEHSCPFSWETKSQLKLHLLLEENGDSTDGQAYTPKTPPSARSYKKLPTPKVTPRPSPKPSPALTRKSMKAPAEQIVLAQPKVNPAPAPEKILTKRPDRPKGPAPPPPVTLSNQPPPKSKEIKEKEQKVEKPTVTPVNHLTIPIVKEKEVEAVVVEVEAVVVEEDAVVVEEDAVVVDDAVSDSSSQLDVETPSSAIPKTGFDFLDNW